MGLLLQKIYKRRYKGPKKLLVLRIDGIGDLVLFAPSLQYLKNKYPDFKITLLLRDYVSTLFESCPFINDIILLNTNRYRKNIIFKFGFLFKIYLSGFYTCIYPAYSRERIGDEIVLWSCTTERIGWDTEPINMSSAEKKLGDSIYTKLFKSNLPKNAHELESNKQFLKLLGIKIDTYKTDFWINKKQREFASLLWEKYSLANKIVIALIPGAARKNKAWPPDNYKLLIKKISALSKKYFFVLIGSATEKIMLDFGDNTCDNIINLCEKIKLSELVALLEKCSLFIGNDTGPSHIAINTGIPGVCILGGGQFDRFMPYGDKKRILFVYNKMDCFNCGWKCIYPSVRCIDNIGVNDVLKNVMRLLDTNSDWK